MSIMIREYLGYSNAKKEGFSVKEAVYGNRQDLEPMAPNSLMVDIEGIHEGATRNFTRYMKSALVSSVDSWTRPYQKPLIMHHNEKDGKIIGRIKNVYYTDVDTRSGTGALVFNTNVPDKEGAEQVEDGRLLTVSVGVLAHDVRCSICGHNIAEMGECEHERGTVYESEMCYWDIYEMEGKELSYVIVPSDAYAKNIKIYRPSEPTEMRENERGVSNLKLTESEVKIEKVTETISKTEPIKEAEEVKEPEVITEVVEVKESEEIKESEEKTEAITPESLKLELEEITKKLQEAEAMIASIDEESTRIKEEAEKAKQELADKEGLLKEEKELRENLESQAISQETEMKIVLAENFNLMRKLVGRPEMAAEKIQERSAVSLRDAIVDLKEELTAGIKSSAIPTVENPTITESKTESVKKEKKASNIDLEEGLKDLFSEITGKFSKQ